MENQNRHKTEDRRVKRTKKALKECLFALLENKTVDEITVKELTEAADINRSTFYFYYKDINDMIMQIQNDIYSVFERDVIHREADFNTIADFVQYLTRFLVFVKEHEKICRFVITNDPNNNLAKKIKASLMECIPDSRKIFPSENPKTYLTPFAVAAFWESIMCWMEDGMKISPNEMAYFLSNVYFYGGRTVLQQNKHTGRNTT